jgi:hypothetical protein
LLNAFCSSHVWFSSQTGAFGSEPHVTLNLFKAVPSRLSAAARPGLMHRAEISFDKTLPSQWLSAGHVTSPPQMQA